MDVLQIFERDFKHIHEFPTSLQIMIIKDHIKHHEEELNNPASLFSENENRIFIALYENELDNIYINDYKT